MASYDPPTENLPIFDPIVFTTGDEDSLTTKKGDLRYLRYPTAQGKETLLDVDVAGTATFNKTITLTDGVNTNTITATTFSGTSTNSVNTLATSDNTSGDYFIPFVKTSGTGQKPLFIDDTTTPITINPSTGDIRLAGGLKCDYSNSSMSIGRDAGATTQGSSAVAVGVNAGNSGQGNFSVAIGSAAGRTSQGTNCVAVGSNAAITSQGNSSIAVGPGAGNNLQGTGAVAVGLIAGLSSQGSSSVAIGNSAAQSSQGQNSIAIGSSAGQNTQGSDCIAIGRFAGNTNQHNNSIVLNATGSILNSDGASRSYIDPLRVVNDNGSIVKYNRNTKEMTQYGDIATYPALDPYSSGADAVSTWVSRTSAADNNWNSVCWSPSLKLFCAVAGSGDRNRIMTSPDGINWSLSFTSLLITGCGNGGGNNIAYDTIDPLITTGMTISSITGSGTLLADTKISSINKTLKFITTDKLIAGLSNSTLVIGFGDYDWRSVCWSQELGRFVAVGLGGATMTSTNGINWTLNLVAGGFTWNSVCWSPELKIFVAVNSDGGQRAMTSTNGSDWTLRATPQVIYVSICWSPQLRLFCVVAPGGTQRVMTSPDGINWTPRTPASTSNWRDVAWSPELGLFCAVADSGTGGRVMVSADGINWIGRNTTNFDLNWNSICWSPQLRLFIATSTSGTGNRIMSSPDTITWTLRATPANNAWDACCWSPDLGMFVAVATTGTGNRVMTTSLNTRTLTPLNVFNSPYNRINNDGFWTFNKGYANYLYTGNQTLTANTATIINLNTNVRENGFALGTNEFQILQSGLYKIGVSILVEESGGSGGDFYFCLVDDDGPITNGGSVIKVAGNNQKTLAYAEIIYNAVAGKFVSLYGYSTTSTLSIKSYASPDATIAASPAVIMTIYSIT